MAILKEHTAGQQGNIAALEDYAIQSVPAEKRKSWLNVAFTSCGWIISLSTIFVGGSLAAGMTFGQAILAAVIGMTILAVYGFFQGWMGAKYGVATAVLARQAFGRAGAGLFGILLSLTMGIGWFGWQVAFFGSTIEQMFPGQWFADPTFAIIWGGVLMIFTALIGYKGITYLSFVAVPLVIVLSIWGIFVAADASGGLSDLFALQPTGASLGLFAGITLVVGNAALGAIVFPDVSRYGKTPLAGGMGAAAGYFVGGIFSVVAGAAMTFAAQLPDLGSTPNIPAVMAKLGMGFFAFLILVFAQWSNNDNNLYTGALGLRNVVKLPKFVLVLIMGGLGIVIALTGYQDHFVPFLNFLGVYVPPIAGVMIADHWIVRRGTYQFGEGTKYNGINLAAIAAVIIAGVIASNIAWGISPINSTVLGLIIYPVLTALLRLLRIPYEWGQTTEDSTGY
ncbi:cytosine permease [Paenibacillus sonchi]|uniref:cytosine permease n=1 Tax=Paenibacillus sonchi TaxID=373687 RepID=UPI001E3CEAAB|nr:cytosine permease [Paenibacillus sonchi]MCE3201598.1 cytosine permease [Paenibacillus sonchi]